MNLYRGFNKLPEIGSVIITRKDRKPRNLDPNIHLRADEIFFKNFGYKFRSQSVFCTGDISCAKRYGTVARIEPLGDYEICWSPKCYDFIDIEDSHLFIEEFIEENEYQLGNIEKAIESNNEIMLFCEKYKIIEIIHENKE